MLTPFKLHLCGIDRVANIVSNARFMSHLTKCKCPFQKLIASWSLLTLWTRFDSTAHTLLMLFITVCMVLFFDLG